MHANAVARDARSSISPVAVHGDYRVTLVRPDAPFAQRRLAERVGRWGNRETHDDFGVYVARETQMYALIAWLAP